MGKTWGEEADTVKSKPMAKANKGSYLWLWILLILLTAVIALGLGGVMVGMRWLSPVSLSSEKIDVVISRGSSSTKVGRQLQEAGIIHSDLAFRIYSRYRGLDKKIQAGLYTLDRSWTLQKIVAELLNNPSGVSVTLVEGWRREQMAEALGRAFGEQNPNFSAQEFVALTANLEGQLFPDTYQFELFASSEKVVQVLNQRYQTIMNSLEARNQAVGYSDLQLTTLASLIEREAAIERDRKLVAGVLFNRLEIGMPLQIDATLQYVRVTRACGGATSCDNWWPAPRADDKELVSPYNTYLGNSLPPMPIASPGRASLEAAHDPQDSDYFYYLTDNSGVTHYAVTYEQHLVNINRYLR